MVRPETDRKGWHSHKTHIDGAVALITSGRRRLFRSKISRELFLSIRELMVSTKFGVTEQQLTFVRQSNILGPQKHPTVEYTGGLIESQKKKSHKDMLCSISMWPSFARITTKLQPYRRKRLAIPKLLLNFSQGQNNSRSNIGIGKKAKPRVGNLQRSLGSITRTRWILLHQKHFREGSKHSQISRPHTDTT